MQEPNLTTTRRAVLGGLAGLCALGFRPAAAQTVMQVAKDPNCGCCADWVAIIEAEGFAVSVVMMEPEALQAHKVKLGIPANLTSCHTAQIDGYVIEGHVPPADIRRVLNERPDALGLAVPGMPYGSPGMGPESAREAYDVVLILRDGQSEVFARYPAA